MLFESTIFGPIKSRRLGNSLGVNLLPPQAKICSFDCIYCECGYNFTNKDSHMPTAKEVAQALEQKLCELKSNDEHLDVITFAGNGEPTLHPEFEQVIDDTLRLRDDYFPEAKVSVLSNATLIMKPTVFAALNRIDNNILKLDSAVEETVKLINQPTGHYSVEETIEQLSRFNGNVIIQTLFFSGTFNGVPFDNSSDKELQAWLEALKRIKPKQVMLYSLDRETPAKGLIKATPDILRKIALQVQALGFDTLVTE